METVDCAWHGVGHLSMESPSTPWVGEGGVERGATRSRNLDAHLEITDFNFALGSFNVLLAVACIYSVIFIDLLPSTCAVKCFSLQLHYSNWNLDQV